MSDPLYPSSFSLFQPGKQIADDVLWYYMAEIPHINFLLSICIYLPNLCVAIKGRQLPKVSDGHEMACRYVSLWSFVIIQLAWESWSFFSFSPPMTLHYCEQTKFSTKFFQHSRERIRHIGNNKKQRYQSACHNPSMIKHNNILNLNQLTLSTRNLTLALHIYQKKKSYQKMKRVRIETYRPDDDWLWNDMKLFF